MEEKYSWVGAGSCFFLGLHFCLLVVTSCSTVLSGALQGADEGCSPS